MTPSAEVQGIPVVDPNAPQLNQFHEGEIKTLRHFFEAFVLSDRPECVELGSWMGLSACAIGLEIKKRKRGHLWCVDTWRGEGSLLEDVKCDARGMFEQNIKLNGLDGYVDAFPGTTDDFFDHAMKNAYPSADWIFLDADHRYSSVVKDIWHAWSRLKIGGILVGHDYDGPGYDQRYVEQDFVEGKHHGVTKALEEFLKIRPGLTLGNADTLWYIRKVGYA